MPRAGGIGKDVGPECKYMRASFALTPAISRDLV